MSMPQFDLTPRGTESVATLSRCRAHGNAFSAPSADSHVVSQAGLKKIAEKRQHDEDLLFACLDLGPAAGALPLTRSTWL